MSKHCFNPLTGKRDGGYCVWEGGGKCLNCQAADRIIELTAEVKDLREELFQTTADLETAEAQLEKVRPYLRHKRECAKTGSFRVATKCTCGLQTILEKEDE